MTGLSHRRRSTAVEDDARRFLRLGASRPSPNTGRRVPDAIEHKHLLVARSSKGNWKVTLLEFDARGTVVGGAPQEFQTGDEVEVFVNNGNNSNEITRRARDALPRASRAVLSSETLRSRQHRERSFLRPESARRDSTSAPCPHFNVAFHSVLRCRREGAWASCRAAARARTRRAHRYCCARSDASTRRGAKRWNVLLDGSWM